MGDIEDVVSVAIDCGFHLHKELGPGVLESVYEALLAERLKRRGLFVERQKPLPIVFDGISLAEGFRVDLLIDRQLIIEVKSVERLAPLHSKQLLTYLRLAKQSRRTAYEFRGRDVPRGPSPDRQRSDRL